MQVVPSVLALVGSLCMTIALILAWCLFPGTEHGFAFAERPVYNTLAAEETWDKMFAMWDRNLKG